MKAIFLIALLVGTYLPLNKAETSLSFKSQQEQVSIYNDKIYTLRQLLSSECLGYKMKREVVNEHLIPFHLEVAKSTYNLLLRNLVECRKLEYPTNSSSLVPTLAIKAAATSPTKMATTIPTQPAECLTAKNLTQSWRSDHKGRNIRPGGPHSSRFGYNCDLHKDLQWFRFSGQAGWYS